MKPILKGILGMAVATQLAFGAVVSPPSQATVVAAGNSFSPTFSADGQHLLFVSHANNLVTNDNLNVWLDVFVRDLVTSNTVLVSVGTSGTGGANADSDYPTISSNGQLVAFASYATDLVPGVANAKKQIFLRDLVNQTTFLVSTGRVGGAADSGADFPQISRNGKWVAFESRSSNLSLEDLNLNSLDVYARDLQNGTNILVSINAVGSGANDSQGEKSYWPVITPTGRHVAFLSTALNLLTGAPMPSSSLGDLYLRDLISKTTAWVSVNVPALFSGNPYRCSAPVISDDGRCVAFIAAKESGGSFILRHDLQTSTTLTISSAATNTQHGIQMSSDGRFVLFEEIDGDFSRVRLWDAQSSNSLSISCSGEGVRGNAAMDAGSTAIAFIGCATNVHVSRTNSDTLRIFVRASVSTNGGASEGEYQFVTPVISPDGSRVAFAATARDLIAGDLNNASDVFLRDINANVTELITRALPAKPAMTAFAHSFLNLNSISGDGRFIVSTRYDDPSVYRDTNGWADVFVSDVLSGTSLSVSIISNLYGPTNLVGGAGPGFAFFANTNAFENPVISVDGSTIYAVRRSPNGRTRIFHAFTTNAAASAGMSLASRGINVSENGNSYSPSTSSNGLLLVFTSTSSDLDASVPDNNSLPDIYLRRMSVLTNGLLAGTNELVSISRFGNAGNNWSSNAFISPDGRWVIFESRATDLVTNNTAGLLSLFARDLWSNATHLVSTSPTGNDQWGYKSGSATISGDSRYVAFSSGNIYLTVHDLFTHTSVVAENPTAVSPSLSTDGRLVAFVKQTFGSPLDQIHVRDLQASQSDLISANPVGAPGNGASGSPVVSADGRYVVFQSQASNLVLNDTNGMSDIFVRDRLLGVTMPVSANAQGGTGNGPSTRPVMAADGRTVVFQGFASDLVTGDYNDKRDIFVLKLGGADTDGDGMDDDWEVAYFDNLSRNGASDFDGDGVSDRQEFLAGTDPTDINSFFRVLTVAPAGGGSKLLFWSGNPARSYRAEFKDSLGATSWTALTGTISWNGSTASITDAAAGSATNRYYRVVRLP